MNRVLLITAYPFHPWCGAALRARHTAAALAGLGYAVDVLAPPGGEPPELPGVRVVQTPRIPGVGPMRPDGASARGIYRFLLAVWTLALARANRYRIVHAVGAAWPAARLAARLCDGGLVYEADPQDPLAARRASRALRRADAVVAAEPEGVDAMRRLGRQSRACLIPDIPGTWQEADEAGRLDARARLGAPPEAPVLTYVGSFRKFQGVDLVFNALPAVLRDEPRARLVMVGGTPQEIVSARAIIRAAGLEQAVAFLGRIPAAELVQVLGASDILLAPRRTGEHVPMKVLDYLRSGTAIVATDCAANRIALSSACALLVRPSPEALAAGILALARDPERRAALGAAGRERVAGEFSFAAFQDGLKRCYAYVLLTGTP
jgi:glycosyltransferase involved in cell wall biosynthesis